ncbi:MAG: hypothetical protein RL033_8076 [Pseudomonadota bacterium]|jgi:hypothetical protein
MTKLNTADRKNVNVLGEDDLARVVGGRGGHWPQHGGGGGGGGMNKYSGGGMGKRGGRRQGRITINITIVQVAPGGVFAPGNTGVIDVTND